MGFVFVMQRVAFAPAPSVAVNKGCENIVLVQACFNDMPECMFAVALLQSCTHGDVCVFSHGHITEFGH